MRISSEAWVRLLSGEQSVEAFAAQHGVSVGEARALREEGFSRLERRRRASWRTALVALCVLVPGAALAQLVTFQADQPAQAAQVNGNFTLLRTWIESKVGPVGNAGITATTITASSITSNGNLIAGATTVNGNLTVASNGNLVVPGTTNFTGATTAGAVTASSLNTANLTATTGTLTNTTVNGIRLRVKPGNNGSVNCDTYCSNSGYGNFTGACIGIKLPSGQHSADCAYVPGTLPSGELGCLCATF